MGRCLRRDPALTEHCWGVIEDRPDGQAEAARGTGSPDSTTVLRPPKDYWWKQAGTGACFAVAAPFAAFVADADDSFLGINPTHTAVRIGLVAFGVLCAALAVMLALRALREAPLLTFDAEGFVTTAGLRAVRIDWDEVVSIAEADQGFAFGAKVRFVRVRRTSGRDITIPARVGGPNPTLVQDQLAEAWIRHASRRPAED